jgi:hypothetical protein
MTSVTSLAALALLLVAVFDNAIVGVRGEEDGGGVDENELVGTGALASSLELTSSVKGEAVATTVQLRDVLRGVDMTTVRQIILFFCFNVTLPFEKNDFFFFFFFFFFKKSHDLNQHSPHNSSVFDSIQNNTSCCQQWRNCTNSHLSCMWCTLSTHNLLSHAIPSFRLSRKHCCHHWPLLLHPHPKYFLFPKIFFLSLLTYMFVLLKKGSPLAVQRLDAGVTGGNNDFVYFKIVLPEALKASASIKLVVRETHIGLQEPYPASISQSETQLVRFSDSIYFASPYVAQSQKTVLRLASATVESYSTQVQPVDAQGPDDHLWPVRGRRALLRRAAQGAL